MKQTRIAFHFPDATITVIVRDLPVLLLGMLVWVLLAAAAANTSLAGDKESNDPSSGHTQGRYIDEAESNAYKAAKKEPDSKKRAVKLLEFLQKYPKSALMESSDYAEVRVIEDEYNAFYAAGQEPDYEKRADKLIEFIQKYQTSTLAGNVDYEYIKMLKEALRDKKYELLESLGERWLKIRLKDKEVYALVAEATMNLGKYQRCAECLEEIYRIEPTPSLAREIHTVYQKTKNVTKQLEWADRLFKMPEFDADYMLRYESMMGFLNNNDLPKAAEYANLVLKSTDLAKNRDKQMEAQWRKVRRASYHVIAINLKENGNFIAAISAFRQAIKAERYGQGYYEIAACQENQKNVEEAMIYYAMAETMGEETALKAKARLEILYRALHNDTLIGIDKVYSKAKKKFAEPD
jgi:hypothetical protein